MPQKPILIASLSAAHVRVPPALHLSLIKRGHDGEGEVRIQIDCVTVRSTAVLVETGDEKSATRLPDPVEAGLDAVAAVCPEALELSAFAVIKCPVEAVLDAAGHEQLGLGHGRQRLSAMEIRGRFKHPFCELKCGSDRRS
jgi:hypothetical protein